MRIRQIALVADDIDAATSLLGDALGLEVAFRDPAIVAHGFDNAVFVLGDTYLEVVSPRTLRSPAGRLLTRRGPGGYMLIVQSDDIAADRARISRLGVRVVWETSHADLEGVHLHPGDVGGVILSIDEAHPPTSWRWAGPHWQDAPASARARAITGAVLGAPEPMELARRWSMLLGHRCRESVPEICLASGRVGFEAAPTVHLAAIEIASDVDADLTVAGLEFRLRSGQRNRWDDSVLADKPVPGEHAHRRPKDAS